ncbi:Ubiquitin carboxyl-terminal hydrolase 47 [Phytophthora boehmeriae]|uniref:Ubiquitin carboxyl-terminal hydrolase 47 n=1 Tax=Phytophthora boehmeriae TaxID=109152 RepID=A0A8T1X5U7_9STRA|nr:Ubiquitin carboxyl-terminal hydrolase 47 [Phytophthora boehmeriae]
MGPWDDDDDVHRPQPNDDDDDFSSSRQQHRAQVASVLSQLPRPAEEDDEGDALTASSPSVQSTALTTYSSSGFEGPYDSTGYTSNGGSSYSSAGGYSRPRNAFTGLSNQGATCYMNSLLQSMFMTPEFRQGLYRWTCHNALKKTKEETEEGEESEEEEADEDNIPLQLQNLFAKLQLTTQDSISTKALTKSFGWTGADVFQQHDVQELCRVLLDALERSFKDTVNENLVNDLYQGALKDYVQCCECKYESSRIDNFLDLSLVIRPFGSTEMMKTVEEAIELFLRPELLNKENQWMCDRCKVKRDAIKGLKFSKLPYVLMLQLKRFDFDYTTMNRIKLHNEVTFPKYLDMNSYVSDESGGVRGKIARKMSEERHVLEGKNCQGLAPPEETAPTLPCSPPLVPGLPVLTERIQHLSPMDESQSISFANDDEDGDDTDPMDDGITEFDTWSPTFDPEVMIKRSGPHVYELYSVLIHSGSALGGHYYAYIKSLETGKWYNFNDSTVSEISDTELKTAFGGATGSGYSMRYSTCAYMLMYRLVSPDKNVNVIQPESIPQYLKDKIHDDEEKIRRLEQERIEMAKKVQVKFFMKGNKPKSLEKAIHVYKTATIREALETACKEFAKEKDVVVPLIENVRLRGYNDYNCLLSDTYDGKEDMTLTSLGIYAGQQMFLEVKSDEEEWEEHDPTKLQLFIRRFVDSKSAEASDNRTSLMAKCLQVDDDANLESLCALVATKFSVPNDMHVRLIKKSATTYSLSAAKILNANDEERTCNLRLKMDLHLVNGTELYFEETPDLTQPSPAEIFFEREANMITVNFKYLSRVAEPIRIDRRETIRTLKDQISAKIGLPPNRFKLLRGINSAGVEIKAIDSTLSKLSIGSNHTVFALEGVPLNTGEYNFRLMFYQPSNGVANDSNLTPSSTDKNNQNQQSIMANSSADGSDTPDPFDIDEVLVATGKDDSLLTFVNHIVISEEMLVESIRQNVWDELVKWNFVKDDNHLTPSHVRLRDLRQSTMTSVLVDGQKLVEASKLAVYEGRSIVAELLPEPETSEVNHRIVEFAYVNRSAWRFVKNMRHEVIISSEEESAHPQTYLADAASAVLSIPAERLLFARIPYHRDSIDILEVVSYEFLPASAFANKETEYQELFLVVDNGVLFSYMNNHERQLIQSFLAKKSEEKTRALRAKYSSSYNSNNTYQYQKPKEAALVIRTRSRTSEKEQKGGSVGSSNGKNSNGVRICTPTRRSRKSGSAAHHASSDTDEEDDTDYMTEKPEALDMDLFGDLS